MTKNIDILNKLEFKKKAYNRIGCIALLVTFLFFCIFTMKTTATPICIDDCDQYIKAMGYPLTDLVEGVFQSWRPWAVVAFFSLFGSYSIQSAQEIVVAQTIILFLSWAFFAYILSKYLIKNKILQLLSYIFLLGMVFSNGYYHLNQYLSSDSLALGSVLILYSLVMIAAFGGFSWLHGCNWLRLFFYSLIIFVFCVTIATRDSNISLGVGAILFLIIVEWKSDCCKIFRVCLAVIVIFLVSLQILSASWRHQLNAVNFLTGYVLPNPDVREFFLKNGMPAELGDLGDKMPQQNFGNANISEMLKAQALVMASPSARHFIAEFDGIYIKYIISHPSIIINRTVENFDLIFKQDLSAVQFSGEDIIKIGYLPVQAVDMRPLLFKGYRAFEISALFLILYIISILYQKRGISFIRSQKHIAAQKPLDSSSQSEGDCGVDSSCALSLIPILIAALGASNAIMGFHGDLWETSEMQRHALIGSFLFRVGGALAFVCLISSAAQFAIDRCKRLKGAGAGRS